MNCNIGPTRKQIGKIEEEVLVEVVEKPYISDMSNFLYFIRK